MRVHSTTVIVRDQQAAVDFYTQKFGWTIGTDAQVTPEMRFVTMLPNGGGAEIALGDMGWIEGRTPGGHTGISLQTDDIDGEVAALTARGVRFKGPIESVPWGRHTWFYDQDDNEFYLVGM